MKKGIIALKIYLLIFTILFGISFYGHYTGLNILDLDVRFPYATTNLAIMIISVAGIVKTLWHIIRY